MLRPRAGRLVAATGLIWLAVAAGPAFAQANDDIVVTGRTPETTQRFVDQISAPSQSADQLARWDRGICTGVAGLPVRQAQFIADRVAQRAMQVGLDPGAAGCTPNVSIVISSDADALARRMYEQDRAAFAYRPENGVSSLGEAALNAFLTTDRPVRWWQVSRTVSADGLTLHGDTSNGGLSNAPVARSGGTRLREDVRQDLDRAVIIVDAGRVGDVQLAALADYIAMVALAQVSPDAQPRNYPTILNLFAEQPARSRAAALTEWDEAYLQGLYSATRNAATVRQHQGDIARRMLPGQG